MPQGFVAAQGHSALRAQESPGHHPALLRLGGVLGTGHLVVEAVMARCLGSFPGNVGRWWEAMWPAGDSRACTFALSALDLDREAWSPSPSLQHFEILKNKNKNYISVILGNKKVAQKHRC